MKRLHVVLDTNVLISALLFAGAPREILEMIIIMSPGVFLGLARKGNQSTRGRRTLPGR